MTNFLFTIQYDGSRYNGWQRQGNTQNTIQGKIEQVLAQAVGHKAEIHGAGRTDAGVHANAQMAHCRLNTELDALAMQRYLNRYLPTDIAVTHCDIVPERFHARLNAQGKRYIYRLYIGEVPNVFTRKYVYAWEKEFSLTLARQAAELLIGTHDFRAFSSGRTKKSTTRTLTRIDIIEQDEEIKLVFEGTGFLQNMVRILTGTIAEIAAGERTLDSISAAFASQNRADAGITMPPKGLLLDEVFYEEIKK